MPEIIQKLGCPDCGAPLKVQAGDAIVTCGEAVQTIHIPRHCLLIMVFRKVANE